MKLQPWTMRERRELREMQERGLRHAEIARRLGRSVSSVRNVVSAMGLGRKIRRPMPWSPEEDARLHELYAQGVTYDEIGKLLDRHTVIVRKRTYELGLPKRGQGGLRR